MAKAVTSLEELRVRRAWTITLVLSLVLAFVFLERFISIIMLATLVAYLTYPVYGRLHSKTNNKGISATITTFFTLLVIGIPLLIVIAIAVVQGINFVDSLNLENFEVGNGNLQAGIDSFVAWANTTIENLVGASDVVSKEGIVNFLEDTVPSLLRTVFDALVGVVSGIPNFFLSLIIFLFVYVGLLTGAENLQKTVKGLSPFDDKVNDEYLKRIGLMAKSMVKGQLLIAFLQGLGAAASLAIIGWGSYFWFFLILFTFMSLIPLGSGIVTIPLGVLLIALGQVWEGIFVLLVHFVYVTNIDNIRPKLVAKEARMPAALTILAAFAGVAYFGLLGVIYGPIIMIFITTTIELYMEYNRGQKKVGV